MRSRFEIFAQLLGLLAVAGTGGRGTGIAPSKSERAIFSETAQLGPGVPFQASSMSERAHVMSEGKSEDRSETVRQGLKCRDLSPGPF